jgi:hypothetical protein
MVRIQCNLCLFRTPSYTTHFICTPQHTLLACTVPFALYGVHWPRLQGCADCLDGLFGPSACNQTCPGGSGMYIYMCTTLPAHQLTPTSVLGIRHVRSFPGKWCFRGFLTHPVHNGPLRTGVQLASERTKIETFSAVYTAHFCLQLYRMHKLLDVTVP